MKNKYDFDHIRRLLQRYYEAETTPDEESFLQTFFCETPEAEIPIDMADDRKLFSAIQPMQPLESECEVPEDLFEKIETILASRSAAPIISKRHKWNRIILYSGVAAIACIIMVVIGTMTNRESGKVASTSELVVETPEVIKTPLPDKASETPNIATTGIVKTAVPKNTQMNESSSAVRQPEEKDDGFIEITDPEEARKIAMEIGKVLALNSDKVNGAISRLGNTIDNYKEMTKSILQ